MNDEQTEIDLFQNDLHEETETDLLVLDSAATAACANSHAAVQAD